MNLLPKTIKMNSKPVFFADFKKMYHHCICSTKRIV